MIHTVQPKPLLQLTNVEQSFTVDGKKIRVLKQIDLVIEKHSFNIIYGQSGSGKSTLLNIITGLQPPSAGTVTFDGQDMYNLSSDQVAYFRSNKIGIVYQQNFWVRSLNVVDNVAMPLFTAGYSRSRARRRALVCLDSVGMKSYAKKSPTFLSSGEQQRIAMARALVNDPDCIVADEPTGNLDTENGTMIMTLLQKYQEVLGKTIILVTHNIEYIALADHLLHVQDGRLADTGNDDDILTTANELFHDMKVRIEKQVKEKHRG